MSGAAIQKMVDTTVYWGHRMRDIMIIMKT